VRFAEQAKPWRGESDQKFHLEDSMANPKHIPEEPELDEPHQPDIDPRDIEHIAPGEIELPVAEPPELEIPAIS